MRPTTFNIALLLTVLVIPALALAAHLSGWTDLAGLLAASSVIGFGTFAAGRLQGDAELKKTTALPAASGATATSDGLDLEITDKADFGGAELRIESPALTAVEMTDGAEATYSVYHDDNSDFSTELALHASVLTVASGYPYATAATVGRVGLPTNVKRYVRVKATHDSAGDPSGKSFVASVRM